jgi:hypothetical protein
MRYNNIINWKETLLVNTVYLILTDQKDFLLVDEV